MKTRKWNYKTEKKHATLLHNDREDTDWSSTMIVLVSTIEFSFRVSPAKYCEELRNKAWILTFDKGVIANNDILLTTISLEYLTHN